MSCSFVQVPVECRCLINDILRHFLSVELIQNTVNCGQCVVPSTGPLKVRSNGTDETSKHSNAEKCHNEGENNGNDGNVEGVTFCEADDGFCGPVEGLEVLAGRGPASMIFIH